MDDPYDLKRFVTAQDAGGTYQQAVAELRRGRKAQTQDRTAEQIFGGIDAQKLRSCVTLFLRADPGQPVFGQVLAQYFDGRPDPATDQRI